MLLVRVVASRGLVRVQYNNDRFVLKNIHALGHGDGRGFHRNGCRAGGPTVVVSQLVGETCLARKRGVGGIENLSRDGVKSLERPMQR